MISCSSDVSIAELPMSKKPSQTRKRSKSHDPFSRGQSKQKQDREDVPIRSRGSISSVIAQVRIIRS